MDQKFYLKEFGTKQSQAQLTQLKAENTLQVIMIQYSPQSTLASSKTEKRNQKTKLHTDTKR